MHLGYVKNKQFNCYNLASSEGADSWAKSAYLASALGALLSSSYPSLFPVFLRPGFSFESLRAQPPGELARFFREAYN
jgi:hypothetical protein